MLIHQGWFTALYTQHLLDSQSLEFRICIFPREAIPSHYFPPLRRLVPSLGLGTTWVRQLRSGSCHYPTAATKCNKKPSQATGGKACSSTKGGLLRYIPNTYSIHKVSSLAFAYFQGRLSRHKGKTTLFVRQKHFCPFCPDIIESEVHVHFLLNCNKYDSKRQNNRFILEIVHDFGKGILNTQTKQNFKSICNFIGDALHIRKCPQNK